MKHWYNLSHKSQGLILLGLIWIAFGWSVHTGVSASNVSGAWHTYWPAEPRAAMWYATGAYAMYAAVRRRHKNLALAFLVVMPAIRMSSFLTAWVVALVPGLPEGQPQGWYSAAFYLVMILLVWYVATSPAPPVDRNLRTTEG